MLDALTVYKISGQLDRLKDLLYGVLCKEDPLVLEC